MYSVPQAYIEQMMKRGTRRRLSGMIGTIPFSGDDIVLDSFSISGRSTEESDTKIGGVYLGELEMTFLPSFLNKIPRSEYEGKEVSVNIGLYVEEEGEEPTWIDVPCGVYTLQAPKISKQGITVSGYDHMKKLDKRFRLSASTATPFGFLSYISTECQVQLGNTQLEIEALPNGTESLGLYEENDIETFRDLLYWIAQTCGCFACADKMGRIVLRRMGIENGISFDEDHRDADVVFSGYVTKWTGVSFVDIATKTTRYYGLPVDDGLTMNMGANPLLQLGTVDAVERRRRNVLNAIAEIQYTPFYVNSARDPIFELGDEIEFIGGISGDCIGCIMAYSFNLDNFSFEGYGDNPALADGKSKTDKNIAGLMQSTVENEVTYYNYVNLDAIEIEDEHETEIASLAFTAAQTTTVKILHEFIFDMVKNLGIDSGYELRYYLDGELVSYKPYESLSALVAKTDVPIVPQPAEEPYSEPVEAEFEDSEISITRDFFYIIRNVAPNQRHTWKVCIVTHGMESTTIDVEHAHIVLEGQRLYGEEYFDGYINIAEEVNRLSIVGIGVVNTSEDVDFDFENIALCEGSDNIPVYEIDALELKTITDTPHMYIESLRFTRLTEEGGRRLTEDGELRISE